MTTTTIEGPRKAGMIPVRRDPDRTFYPALAILISATCFAGFAFTYFGPVIGGSYPRAGIPLHVHGWSFFLWYLLFPLQAGLIAKGKYALHATLGVISISLVVVMTFTGVLVLSVRVEEAVHNGMPEVWLLYGPLILSNLILFLAFYAAAIHAAMKNRLQAHKRLIILASAAGLGAGFSRVIMVLSDFHPLSIPAGTLGCGLFIIIGMFYDGFTRRTVHPVYWIGIAALLMIELSLLPQVNPDAVASINQGLAAIGDHLGVLYEPHPTVEF